MAYAYIQYPYIGSPKWGNGETEKSSQTAHFKEGSQWFWGSPRLRETARPYLLGI